MRVVLTNLVAGDDSVLISKDIASSLPVPSDSYIGINVVNHTIMKSNELNIPYYHESKIVSNAVVEWKNTMQLYNDSTSISNRDSVFFNNLATSLSFKVMGINYGKKHYENTLEIVNREEDFKSNFHLGVNYRFKANDDIYYEVIKGEVKGKVIQSNNREFNSENINEGLRYVAYDHSVVSAVYGYGFYSVAYSTRISSGVNELGIIPIGKGLKKVIDNEFIHYRPRDTEYSNHYTINIHDLLDKIQLGSGTNEVKQSIKDQMFIPLLGMSNRAVIRFDMHVLMFRGGGTLLRVINNCKLLLSDDVNKHDKLIGFDYFPVARIGLDISWGVIYVIQKPDGISIEFDLQSHTEKMQYKDTYPFKYDKGKLVPIGTQYRKTNTEFLDTIYLRNVVIEPNGGIYGE